MMREENDASKRSSGELFTGDNPRASLHTEAEPAQPEVECFLILEEEGEKKNLKKKKKRL